MDSYNWNEQNNQNGQNDQNMQYQTSYQMPYQTSYQESYTKQNNIGMGILGAFLGAFIGAAAIVLIGELGYVSVLGGLVMGLCTIKGYEMLAGGVDKKGIIACIVVMILMTFGAEYFQWAFDIYSELKTEGYTLLDILPYTWSIIADAGYVEDFFSSLGLSYLFTAIGAIGIIRRVYSAN